MYYCPKCDRTIEKERIDQADRELRNRFGIDKLSHLRCPVCDTEYIDLEAVKARGKKHVGKARKES
ncbi:MAG TPA: hypothetical protein VGB78_10445 [Thermoplasmata archaeon]